MNTFAEFPEKTTLAELTELSSPGGRTKDHATFFVVANMTHVRGHYVRGQQLAIMGGTEGNDVVLGKYVCITPGGLTDGQWEKVANSGAPARPASYLPLTAAIEALEAVTAHAHTLREKLARDIASGQFTPDADIVDWIRHYSPSDELSLRLIGIGQAL